MDTITSPQNSIDQESTPKTDWVTENIWREEYIIYLCIIIPILLILCFRIIYKYRIGAVESENNVKGAEKPKVDEGKEMNVLGKATNIKAENKREDWDKRDSCDRTRSINTDYRSDSIDSKSALGQSYIEEKNANFEGDLATSQSLSPNRENKEIKTEKSKAKGNRSK